MQRIYLDTNVIIDLLGEREPFVEDAQKIFSLGVNRKVALLTSSISLATSFYFIRKRYPEQDSRNRIRLFLMICQILNPEDFTITSALLSPFSDFEDALQHAIAQQGNCDFIVTRNTKDFTHAKIPVLTPAEFISLWKQGF